MKILFFMASVFIFTQTAMANEQICSTDSGDSYKVTQCTGGYVTIINYKTRTVTVCRSSIGKLSGDTVSCVEVKEK